MIEEKELKAKKARENREISERHVSKELKFKLTTDEFAIKGKQAAEFNKELNEKSYEFDSIKKRFKGALEGLEMERDDLLRTIREGEEMRMVDCIEIKDYKKLLVSYVYGGVVMLERAMELNERQTEMKVVQMDDVKASDQSQSEKAFENATPEERQAKRDMADVMRDEKNAKTKKEIFN